MCMNSFATQVRRLGATLVFSGSVVIVSAVPVTFQVDMSSQPLAQNVYIRGSFNGWGTGNQLALSEVSGVYTGTVDIADSPGTVESCKFFYIPGDKWEDAINNRQFILAATPQTLPLTSFEVSDWPAPTNVVTFHVDMTAQVELGNFMPGDLGQTIRVAGGFTGWGDGADLTNNPAQSGNASNIYTAVLEVIGFPASALEYKFRLNGGWENPLSTGGNNRTLTLAGGDQVLPLVYYNDASICDLVLDDTTVTFSLRITNGTVATDGTVFDRATHSVRINGEFNNWNGGNWDLTLPTMNNVPLGSDNFEYATVIPKGRTLAQKFKFGIRDEVNNLPANVDNEAGFQQDHIQHIRTRETTYTMPYADFGTNFAAVRVESSFGELRIGAPVGGSVPITWLGRPCVTLQVRSSLTGGAWVDLPTTESAQSTNWPLSTGSRQFFRLQKRP